MNTNLNFFLLPNKFAIEFFHLFYQKIVEMEALFNEISNCTFLSETWYLTGKLVFGYLNGTREGFTVFKKFSSEAFPEEYDEIYCMEAWIAYDRNQSHKEFLDS